MAEQTKPEFEGSTSSQTSDPVAWAALGAASRDTVDAFLNEQRELALEQKALVRLQAKELEHELRLRHWSIRFSNISAVMKVSFEIATAFVAILIASLILGALWSAAHDDGLVIHAFSVPPDLAARGMTGEVVAGRLLDKLAAMQTQTESLRPANSYSNNWGDDLKVQIPDTGVSVGELNRYLHQWLGHQTHINGDVVRTGDTLSVTARAGADPAQSFSGKENDFDAILQRVAESVYAQTQPYRYGVYLVDHARDAEASEIFEQLARSGTPSERAWALAGGLCQLALEHNRIQEAEADARAAVALDSNAVFSWYRLGNIFAALSRNEEALGAWQSALHLLAGNGTGGARTEIVPALRLIYSANADDLLGDYVDEVAKFAEQQSVYSQRGMSEGAVIAQAVALAEDHDLSGARRYLARAPGLSIASSGGRAGHALQEIKQQNENNIDLSGALANGNWLLAIEKARAMDEEEPELDAQSIAFSYRPTQIWPLLAYAEAMLGDLRAANRQIGLTPLDCYDCVRIRGSIAARERRWAAAEYWFRDAIGQSPSSPFAYADWGRMLLARGDYDPAIEKFREANLKGPHFPDPLEMWGEALMQKNRSDLALAKFEEANRYAPNWGRLHLEWGKALIYLDLKNEAKKQFAIAAALDLSPPDRGALAKWLRGDDSGARGQKI